MINYLRQLFGKSSTSVRIYYNGKCSHEAGRNPEIIWPHLNIHPPLKGLEGVAAVKHVFKYNKFVNVIYSHSGIIKINMGDISESLLRVNIPVIKFSNVARYNPEGPGGAIYQIEHSRYVKRAMIKLGIHPLPIFYIIGITPAIKQYPHLALSMRNTTVDKALDSIASTFHGIVEYGDCKMPDSKQAVDIEFEWLNVEKHL